MLFARIEREGRPSYALLEGDTLHLLEGDIFGDYHRLDASVSLADARLLAPVVPSKVLAAAVNYHSHVPGARPVLKDESPPSIPQLFLKPPSSIIGPDEPIVLPAGAGRVDLEGEMVAVIGRRCRHVTPPAALDYVFGYTCGNDVSARHWQRDDIQWWRAKGADTFGPIGPLIATSLDPADLMLRTRLNGEVVQETSTAALIHSVAELVSFASRWITLQPGDLVFTGTPGQTPPLTAGDLVEVEIAGIGRLRNPVVAETVASAARTQP